MPLQEFEKDEHFEVLLVSCSTPGAKLGHTKRTIVTILNDDGKIPSVFCVVNRIALRYVALHCIVLC